MKSRKGPGHFIMRVIAGSAKGRKLKAPEGLHTRPTTDRLKEALFGSIQFEISGAAFLDLFAGSGGIGIEALSRGARTLDLVEQDAKALFCIRQNIRELSFERQTRIWAMPVERALKELAKEKRVFDIIFMDPPYLKGWENKTPALIAQYSLLGPKGLLIIESSSQTRVEAAGLVLVKEKEYKTTRFSYLRPV